MNMIMNDQHHATTGLLPKVFSTELNCKCNFYLDTYAVYTCSCKYGKKLM
jgi:predicted amidohydrolase